MLEKILTGLFIGLIGILIGQRLRLGGDSSVKRKRFRSFVTLLCRRIEAKAASDFVFSPEARELPKLEAEVLEVRHCIACRFAGRFDAAVARYKAASFDSWAGPDQKRQEQRDTKNDKAKAELISSLDTLYQCAWWMA